MPGGSSKLELVGRETTAYEWIFQIPPWSTLLQNLEITGRQQYSFNGLKFNEGFLAKTEHNWSLSIKKDGRMYIQLRIVNEVTCRFKIFVLPCHVEGFKEGKLIKRVAFHFKPPRESDNTSYKSLNQPTAYFRDWYTHANLEILNCSDSVDTLKVVLNIQCEPFAQYISRLTAAEEDASEKQNFLNIMHTNTKRYFLSENLSDVTLVAGGVEFPAHRLILSCQSPIFETMFQVEMREKREGRVMIEDMEPEVLKAMLCFLYTGECSTETLKDDHVCTELFKSAHKYEITELRMKCAKRMAETISFENAIGVYILGSTYNQPSLLEKAVDAMKKEKAKVFKNPDILRELTIRYPKLAFELFVI